METYDFTVKENHGFNLTVHTGNDLSTTLLRFFIFCSVNSVGTEWPNAVTGLDDGLEISILSGQATSTNFPAKYNVLNDQEDLVLAGRVSFESSPVPVLPPILSGDLAFR